MANTATLKSTTIPNLPTTSNPQPGDWLVVEHTEPNSNTSNTCKVSISDVFNYVGVLSIPVTNVSPANSTSLVVSKNTIWSDGNYIYVATANSFVKRAALSTF